VHLWQTPIGVCSRPQYAAERPHQLSRQHPVGCGCGQHRLSPRRSRRRYPGDKQHLPM